MINFRRKYIFVHIPKTGGVSIERSLSPHIDYCLHIGAHKNIHEHREGLPRYDFDKFFKFCFVRNPWDRAFSLYSFWRNQKSSDKFYEWDSKQVNVCKRLKFKEFLLRIKQGMPTLCRRPHVKSQYSFTKGVDFIGRFENIDEDYSKVRDALNLPPLKLPHLNKSQHKHYSRAYDEESIQLVNDIYKKDIAEFNYFFEEE